MQHCNMVYSTRQNGALQWNVHVAHVQHGLTGHFMCMRSRGLPGQSITACVNGGTVCFAVYR